MKQHYEAYFTYSSQTKSNKLGLSLGPHQASGYFLQL
jgi:hypothetical protein